MTDDRWGGAGPGAPGERGTTRCAPDWLALREPADAAARATALLAPLREHLTGRPDGPDPAQSGPHEPRLVIRDLGCGTGSMARWLAPRLPVPQHWVLHDSDPHLLARASVAGAGVTFQTLEGDLTGLDLTGTSLLVTSALLDLLTPAEVDTLAAACAAAGCPALLTLSVAGRVELTPEDPLDAEVAAAFDDHQRRGGLLGPDAVAFATRAFERRGAIVHRAPSPWRLGRSEQALTGQWLRGWVAAAHQQDPRLPASDYTRRRLAALAAGELRVVVHHTDLLAIGAR
ncbi:methyltransferase domain-containing protein [Amycolatopsis thermophila]|uniref:SAM-dependent methyltransferase n=1 Tax=Amycolatopsis thermophila TaxID=206084 RepID=A0ABU0F1B8_9PSEU|nr:class I SAM-dependent methyltransferase [Amycolatopsis thermophila]MDQ0380976.1 SAM-dependent methyltransferase [Amycolatopsis thermophila]